MHRPIPANFLFRIFVRQIPTPANTKMNEIPTTAERLPAPGLARPADGNSVNPALEKNIQSFHNVLTRMLAAGANVSDLIFSPGRPPQVELTGDLHGVEIAGLERLSTQNIKAMAHLMLIGNDQAAEILERRGSTDISYSVPGLCRFRVNIFMQRGTHAIVMRVI